MFGQMREWTLSQFSHSSVWSLLLSELSAMFDQRATTSFFSPSVTLKLNQRVEKRKRKSRQLKIFRAAVLSAAAPLYYSCGKLNLVTLSASFFLQSDALFLLMSVISRWLAL